MKSWMLEKAIAASAVAALLSLLSCAPQKQGSSYSNESGLSQSQIVGGVEASVDYQKQNGVVGLVMFMKDAQTGAEGTATCTGTLISQKIILTAAHCVVEPSLQGIAVVFATDTEKATQAEIRWVVDGTVHPDYKGETSDLALLKISEAAPADFKIAKLAGANTKILPKHKLTLAGYGITNAIVRKVMKDKFGIPKVVEVPSSGDGVLRKIDGIPVVSVSAENKEILLDQTNSVGACHGDSGGPAFITSQSGAAVQVGVTSRGTEKLGNCNQGAIYTSVAAHSAWIKQSTAALIAKVAATAAEPTAPTTPVAQSTQK